MVSKEKVKVASREEVKKAKKDKEDKNQDTKGKHKKKRFRIRLIPIWLRVFLVLIFMVISTLVGLILGYSMIGNGNLEDALDKSTWQHIIDLVEKE